jgi:hypothetical protein
VAFAVILLGNNKDFHPTTYLKRKTFPTLTPSSLSLKRQGGKGVSR